MPIIFFKEISIEMVNLQASILLLTKVKHMKYMEK